MGSLPDDRTTTAVIRDEAMALFAERGVADVTVREIAAAAGVSPALVIHHFGSKDGLKEVLDNRAVTILDEMLGELVHLTEDSGAASLAELFARHMEREPALAGYVARILLDDPVAGDRLFATLLQTTRTMLAALVDEGLVRDVAEEGTRAAFLLANDLAAIMLRPRIESALGFDPLSATGLTRWGDAVMDVYARGLYAPVGAAAHNSEVQR